MASTDATPLAKKGVAYRVTFPIFDADGDLVTGAASLDSEVSKDGGTFTDCTNEATEIATASGMYYLDLTATEMNADTVAIIVKTATAGAKTTPIVIYPVEDGDLPVNLTQWRGTQPNTLVSGRADASVGAMASAVLTASAIAANAITAAKIATDAIGAAQLAADAVDEILDDPVEGALTMRQVLRIMLSSLAGKSNGGGTASINFRNYADTLNRIAATVDANGNRTAITLDGS